MSMFRLDLFYRAVPQLVGAFLFLTATVIAYAETITTAPMRGLKRIIPVVQTQEEEAMCSGSMELYDHEVGLLKSDKLVSFDLDKIWQIEINSFNWNGTDDCSLVCDIGFTPNAVVGVGELKDDTPFIHPLTNPLLPQESEPHYAADAVEFIFEDATSATRSVNVFLDFGPAGKKPKLTLAKTFSTMKKGCLTEAMLAITKPSAENNATRFEFVIPYEEMCDPRLFNLPLRVSCVVHDMDGMTQTYLRMKQTKDKK